jgi:ABC-type Zn uptake system ZnuABC Zn-binding protein ZnuA
MDPILVLTWVDVIEQELTAIDSAGAEIYAANAAELRGRLHDLDDWIRERTSLVPPSRRMLVTDHRYLEYFCRRYGFRMVGSLTESFSTLAEPSARELAELQRQMEVRGIHAVFIGMNVSGVLANRLAEDTGAHVVRIHTGALGTAAEGTDNYIGMMQYNVMKIIAALNEE